MLKEFTQKKIYEKMTPVMREISATMSSKIKNKQIKPKITKERENLHFLHTEPVEKNIDGFVMKVWPSFRFNPLSKDPTYIDASEFEVFHPKYPNERILRRNFYGVFFSIDNPSKKEWYGLKFDHKNLGGEELFVFIEKIKEVAKRLDMGVEFKEINLMDSSTGKKDAPFHIYPRFEKGLSQEQAINKLVKFYEAVCGGGVEIMLNKSEGDANIMNVKLREKLVKRKIPVF